MSAKPPVVEAPPEENTHSFASVSEIIEEITQPVVNEPVISENVTEITSPSIEEEIKEEIQPIVNEPIVETEPILPSENRMEEIISQITTEEEKIESTEEEITSVIEDKKEEIISQIANIEEVKKEEKVVFPDLDTFVNNLVAQNAQKEEVKTEEIKTEEPKKEISFAEKTKEINIKTAENKPEEKPATISHTPSQVDDNVEVIEMTRMGKLISKYMVESRRTSAHVQSFTEVDVTRIWNWRNKVKKSFEAREGQKFTFTPIFMEAVAKALRDYPMMNVSTDGERIFKKKQINIGMATALPNGDLIVPVIKNADQLSLIGLAKSVNDLAKRARESKLKPDEIKGGTYTVTNIGAFGNIFGTPIINQPEVGILAIGSIQKVPAVIETPEGDVIGIRYKLILSHSYDHRVVNGALGGMFVQRVAEYLENWDINREI
ncbi:MAG: dihydrolipoamide acetyltransferase family protein [Capnocytophaga sp.]|nr:dihydrolipoamide acetyltransferase family protein [Capnocytophaga sp.]